MDITWKIATNSLSFWVEFHLPQYKTWMTSFFWKIFTVFLLWCTVVWNFITKYDWECMVVPRDVDIEKVKNRVYEAMNLPTNITQENIGECCNKDPNSRHSKVPKPRCSYPVFSSRSTLCESTGNTIVEETGWPSYFHTCQSFELHMFVEWSKYMDMCQGMTALASGTDFDCSAWWDDSDCNYFFEFL